MKQASGKGELSASGIGARCLPCGEPAKSFTCSLATRLNVTPRLLLPRSVTDVQGRAGLPPCHLCCQHATPCGEYRHRQVHGDQKQDSITRAFTLPLPAVSLGSLKTLKSAESAPRQTETDVCSSGKADHHNTLSRDLRDRDTCLTWWPRHMLDAPDPGWTLLRAELAPGGRSWGGALGAQYGRTPLTRGGEVDESD